MDHVGIWPRKQRALRLDQSHAVGYAVLLIFRQAVPPGFELVRDYDFPPCIHNMSLSTYVVKDIFDHRTIARSPVPHAASEARIRPRQCDHTNHAKAATSATTTTRWKRWKISLNRGSESHFSPSRIPT